MISASVRLSEDGLDVLADIDRVVLRPIVAEPAVQRVGRTVLGEELVVAVLTVKPVVAVAARERVVALPAVKRVAPVVAAELVGQAVAANDVVARAALDVLDVRTDVVRLAGLAVVGRLIE